jgi:uncharacterized surface protein with fasciclin (FAS1) repeats
MRRIITTITALTAVLALALPAAAGPGRPGDQTIADIASTNGNFDYLVTALVTADLVGAFDEDDDPKLTVFAPTDAAFESLAGTLGFGADASGVLAMVAFLDGADLLDDVLLYHVTDGRRFSNSVVNPNASKPIATLEGSYLIANPDLTIQDAFGGPSNLVPSLIDINASNGVIHVIDAVLVPQVVVDALNS